MSLRRTRDYQFDFGPSADAAVTLAQLVLQHSLPDRTFLNVNVPKGAPTGFRRTVQGKRNHITKISERLDPRGKPYYWIEEGINEWAPHDQSDYLGLGRLQEQVATLEAEAATLEERWLELSEALEG